jgi:hypothetical protein
VGGTHRLQPSGELQVLDQCLQDRGSGENEHSVWVGFTPARYKLGTWLDIYDDDPCQGTTSTRYYTTHYGEINGVHMSPYPAQSPTTTLACYLPAG